MAERERPMSWEDWKWLHRWPRLTSPEWALEWLVYWCKGLAVFEVLEFAGRASVLIAVILWFWEADDRKKQSHYRAWELINSARGSTGDGGRRDALQDLNEDNVPLFAAPLAGAYLDKTQLPNAILPEANLRGARLGWANLRGAVLTGADLRDARLYWSDLRQARLNEANLTGANLFAANLSQTNFIRANLSGADLTDADLTGAKFCLTIMPDGTVNNRDCPPESSLPSPSEPSPDPN